MSFETSSLAPGAVLAPDPLAAEWADEAWQSEWLAALAADQIAPDDVAVDAPGRDAGEPGVSPVLDDLDATVDAGSVHEVIVGELSGTARASRAMVASQYRLLAELLRHAEADPDPWVGPDPTLDALWEDPRGRSIGQVRADRRVFAVRAAVLDAAVRLTLSESVVRARAACAATLAERCPRLWAAFLDGDVSEQNVTVAARLAQSLPDADADAGAWAAFDEGVVARAVRLTPAKFRTSARALRERVHGESIDARHARANEDRGVWVTPELDGMATLTALLPATDAHAAMKRLDAVARHLRGQADETRTLAQLRADTLTDLLTGPLTTTDASCAPGVASADSENPVASTTNQPAPCGGSAVTANIAITIPALTLLGRGDEPAMLDGYGPIDLDTARELAGSATSWVRILTHPVTGAPLTLDRTVYRVPKALRRWLSVIDTTCIGPGCNRAAEECDIDHVIEWRHGGATNADNLAPECESTHQIKTETLWSLYRDERGRWIWTSPTGYLTEADPPPF